MSPTASFGPCGLVTRDAPDKGAGTDVWWRASRGGDPQWLKFATNGRPRTGRHRSCDRVRTPRPALPCAFVDSWAQPRSSRHSTSCSGSVPLQRRTPRKRWLLGESLLGYNRASGGRSSDPHEETEREEEGHAEEGRSREVQPEPRPEKEGLEEARHPKEDGPEEDRQEGGQEAVPRSQEEFDGSRRGRRRSAAHSHALGAPASGELRESGVPWHVSDPKPMRPGPDPVEIARGASEALASRPHMVKNPTCIPAEGAGLTTGRPGFGFIRGDPCEASTFSGLWLSAWH